MPTLGTLGRLARRERAVCILRFVHGARFSGHKRELGLVLAAALFAFPVRGEPNVRTT